MKTEKSLKKMKFFEKIKKIQWNESKIASKNCEAVEISHSL